MGIKRILYFVFAATLLAAACKKKTSVSPQPEPEAAGSFRVSTSPVTSVSDNMANCGGAVISDGGAAVTDAGVCWDTLPKPMIGRGRVVKSKSFENYACALTGLKPYTRYYVRAYAANSTGTVYGEELEFKTSDVWVEENTIGAVSCAKAYGNMIYAGTGTSLYYRVDTTVSWLKANVPTGVVGAIGLGEQGVFITVNNVLYKSTLNGNSWTLINSMTPAPTTINDLLVDGKMVYAACFEGIYCSGDLGVTWALSDSLRYANVVQLQKAGSAVYAHAYSSNKLYKTPDNGAKWSPLLVASGSGGFVYEVAGSGNNLLASFSGAYGNFISVGAGGSWARCSDLPSFASKFSVTGSDVFCASYRGECTLSQDGGLSWHETTMSGLAPKYLRIELSAITGKRLFISRLDKSYSLRR